MFTDLVTVVHLVQFVDRIFCIDDICTVVRIQKLGLVSSSCEAIESYQQGQSTQITDEL